MNKGMIRTYGILLVAVLIAFGGMYYVQHRRTHARIFLSAGPGIYLDINSAGRVLSTEANNERGQALLEGLDLQQVDLDVALESLTYALYEGGYTDIDKLPLVMVAQLPEAEEEVWISRVLAKMESLLDALTQERE